MNDDEHLAHLEAQVAEHTPMLAGAVARMSTAELQRILDVMSRDRKRLQGELNGPGREWQRVEEAQAQLSWTVAIAYIVGEELDLRERHGIQRVAGSG